MDSPSDDSPCEVTITAPDREWLQAFVDQLVSDRLAAAAHVDVMHTTYRWNGVQRAHEARARLHTRISLVAPIEKLLSCKHEFDVPCLTATRIDAGARKYLQWIEAATLQEGEDWR